jgi:hypothetical protein
VPEEVQEKNLAEQLVVVTGGIIQSRARASPPPRHTRTIHPEASPAQTHPASQCSTSLIPVLLQESSGATTMATLSSCSHLSGTATAFRRHPRRPARAGAVIITCRRGSSTSVRTAATATATAPAPAVEQNKE